MQEFDFSTTESAFEELDKFALLACQKYNLGNPGDWFGAFRGGIYGAKARLLGVSRHFQEAHSWKLVPWSSREAEYHVASILFNMDSAMECVLFGTNAFGYAVQPALFRNVADAQELRKVEPRDVLNGRVRGYERVFPTLTSHWNAHEDLITTIVDQHDVSKHRQTILSGGQMAPKEDAPPGHLDAVGKLRILGAEHICMPMVEHHLRPEPKQPRAGREPTAYEDRVVLEDVGSHFVDFMNASAVILLKDATTNIALPHTDFLP